MIKTERLSLVSQSEDEVSNALKSLDSFFKINDIKKKNEAKQTAKKTENNANIEVKMIDKNSRKLDVIKEEPEKFNITVAKKYFNMWRRKTNRKPIAKKAHITTANQIKEEQIDKFIESLKAKRKENLKKYVQTTTTERSSSRNSSGNATKSASSEIYQNRYKAQRDIILMQKSKLLEQEQIIHELQFGKICDELKETYNDSQNTIKNLLRKFSTRTKVTTGVKIVQEPEDIQMKINKVPNFVKCMEQRAQERELRRQIIQERKRLIDEEKNRLLAEQQENKRIQDEEAKRLALNAIKERRRREVEEDKRRQAEKEKYLKKCRIADKFYKNMLKKRAIWKFKMVVQQVQYNENISIAFYETVLLRKYLHQWRTNNKKLQAIKRKTAMEHYEHRLKRKCFYRFIAVRIKAKQNMQVATDYHAYQLQCIVFKEFYLKVNALRIRRYHLITIATKHYKTRLMVQAFYQWKSLPAVLQLERAKEEKKRKWREKVLQVIPDYKPPELF